MNNLDQWTKKVFRKNIVESAEIVVVEREAEPVDKLVSKHETNKPLVIIESGEINEVISKANKFSVLSDLVDEEVMQAVQSDKVRTGNIEGRGETDVVKPFPVTKVNREAGSPKACEGNEKEEFSEGGSSNIKINLAKELRNIGPIKLLSR